MTTKANLLGGKYTFSYWLREAVLRIVEGSYKKAVRKVSLRQSCHDLFVGRPGITLDCPSMTVLLDPIACSIVLDNAITNAFKHGCTENRELRLKGEISNHDSQTSTAVSFTLIVRKRHCHVFLGGLDPGQVPLKPFC